VAATRAAGQVEVGHAGGEDRLDQSARETRRVEVEQRTRSTSRAKVGQFDERLRAALVEHFDGLAAAARRRSCPQLARSWAISTSLAHAALDERARFGMISSVERERWSPRKVGMAQKPQRRSHPSAILT
jgi:hypothetical protein